MEKQMIYGKMIEVVQKITSIEKKRKNTSQGFMFRGIDDVQNALNGIMGEVGVVCVCVEVVVVQTDRVSRNGTPMIHSRAHIKYRFYAEDGSFIDAAMEGEAMDSGDKSTSKAISIAYKYLLLETFIIPTEELKDPDFETHEVGNSDVDKSKVDKSKVDKSKVDKSKVDKTKVDKSKQRPIIVPNSPNWDKALKYLKDGGDLLKMTKGYQITDNHKNQLVKEAGLIKEEPKNIQ